MKPTLSKEAIARFATMPKPADCRIFTKPKRRMLTPQERAEIVKLRNGGMAMQDIANQIGRHLNTVYLVVGDAVARGECIGMRIERARR